MPEPKKRKLTLKQTKFIKEYIGNGGNASQAVREAYPNVSESTVGVVGHENLNKPHISQEIRALLEAKGVTLDTLNEHLLKILESDDLNVKNKGLRLAYEVIGVMSRTNVTVNTGIVAMDIDKIRQALTV